MKSFKEYLTEAITYLFGEPSRASVGDIKGFLASEGLKDISIIERQYKGFNQKMRHHEYYVVYHDDDEDNYGITVVYVFMNKSGVGADFAGAPTKEGFETDREAIAAMKKMR